MDRNIQITYRAVRLFVALRKESVDRNPGPSKIIPRRQVALRKESVDRNRCSYLHSNMSLESLSARRAWIEIIFARYLSFYKWSLSARRAWIEIIGLYSSLVVFHSRSPQGERG